MTSKFISYLLFCFIMFSFISHSANDPQRLLVVPTEYPTIQSAINAATQEGDHVVVLDGTYNENIYFLGVNIVVRSLHGPENVIIDGQQIFPVVRFKNGNNSTTKLKGFTIRNGLGRNDGGYLYGGGILCTDNPPYNSGSSPTIENNIIIDNVADYGGGICCKNGSDPLITNNVIGQEYNGNSAYKKGGGICCIETSNQNIISNNIISYNTAAEEGGGISCIGSSPMINNNNTISNNSADISGGGIFCDWNWNITNPIGSSPTIDSNTIINNTAESGGGICCLLRSYVTITNNVIGREGEGNTAFYDIINDEGGCGIFCEGDENTEAIVKIKNDNDISYNHAGHKGGGICCFFSGAISDPIDIDSNVIMYNTVDTSGGGIYCGAGTYSEITSNIIEFNESNGYDENTGGAGINVTDNYYTLIYGNRIKRNHEIGEGYGGGIFCYNMNVDIDNNMIKSNSTYRGGSGIYYECDNLSNRKIVNNLIVDNKIKLGSTNPIGGAGILVGDNSDPIIVNNTISDNIIEGDPTVTTAKGGGLMFINNSTPEVKNTIVYFNKYSYNDLLTEIEDDGSTIPLVSYCCVRGGYSGGSNIQTDDPMFAGDNYYHLTSNSFSCIDNATSIGAPETDFEGDSRLLVPVDIGWDEYYP